MTTWLVPSLAARQGGLRRFGTNFLLLRLIPPRGPYTQLFGASKEELVVRALGSPIHFRFLGMGAAPKNRERFALACPMPRLISARPVDESQHAIGNSSTVEHQHHTLRVAGSNPVLQTIALPSLGRAFFRFRAPRRTSPTRKTCWFESSSPHHVGAIA